MRDRVRGAHLLRSLKVGRTEHGLDTVNIVATRHPGEYLLQVGPSSYVLEQNGLRRALSERRAERMLLDTEDPWRFRGEDDRAGSGPGPSAEPSPHTSRPIRAPQWGEGLEWDPERPGSGYTTDGRFHLIGENGEIGPEWDPEWDAQYAGFDPLDPPPEGIPFKEPQSDEED